MPGLKIRDGESSISLVHYTSIKKCTACGRKGIIILACYNYSTDDIEFKVSCKKCFKDKFKGYTLELQCLVCRYNFKCDIQTALFTKKEIKKFRKKFFMNNHERKK